MKLVQDSSESNNLLFASFIKAGENPAASSPDRDIVISICKSYCKLPLKENVGYENYRTE